MSMIVIVVLVLLFLGVLPTWSHSANWGYVPSGGSGLILLVVVVLALTGRLGRPTHR
jgi:fumarate reductase subunit D